MKFIRCLFGIVTTLSVCFGHGDESTVSTVATLRMATRFAVEVPFNTVALNTVPQGLTARQSIAHILKERGILGFYSGAPIELLRSALWYPRMQLMNNPWKVCVPVELTNRDEIREFVEYDSHVSTAANLAAFEMVVMPLFRVRNAFMLHPFQSILDKASLMRKTLYSGSILRGGATFANWYAFFKAQAHAKEVLENKPLSQAAFTIGTQMLVGAATAPL